MSNFYLITFRSNRRCRPSCSSGQVSVVVVESAQMQLWRRHVASQVRYLYLDNLFSLFKGKRWINKSFSYDYQKTIKRHIWIWYFLNWELKIPPWVRIFSTFFICSTFFISLIKKMANKIKPFLYKIFHLDIFSTFIF